MNNNPLELLLATTYSLSKLRKRIRVVRNHIMKKFFNQAEDQELLEAEDKIWLESMNNIFLFQFTKENAYQKLDELEKEISKIQPLIIYVAFDIPSEEVEKIGIWLRREINPYLLCEIKQDPEIIGGCALSWKGIYKDYSLRKRAEDNKDQIIGIFKQIGK